MNAARAAALLLVLALCACSTVRDFLIPPGQMARAPVRDLQSNKAPIADVVLHVGHIANQDDANRCIAVRGNRIVAVGPAAQLESLLTPTTQVLRYSSGFVRPGAIAGPLRLDVAAIRPDAVDLHIATQPAAIRGLLISAHLEARVAGDWAWGAGVRKELLRAMTAADLDAATGSVPVLLTSADGQVVLLNSAMIALEPADLVESLLRTQGRAEGLAAMAAWHRAPALRQERLRPLLLQTLIELQRRGATEVRVVGASRSLVDALVMLETDHRLPMRCLVYLDGELPEGKALLEGQTARPDHATTTVARPMQAALVRVAGVHFWLDGSDDSGAPLLLYSDAQLSAAIQAADRSNQPILFGASDPSATQQVARVLGALARPSTAPTVGVEPGNSLIADGPPPIQSLPDDATGTLAPGALADFVVWSRDPRAPRQPGQEAAEPILAMVGGQPAILSFADRDP